MTTVFLLSFLVVAVAILGLGVGVLLGRKPLKGSCGGDTVLKSCPICAARQSRHS